MLRQRPQGSQRPFAGSLQELIGMQNLSPERLAKTYRLKGFASWPMSPSVTGLALTPRSPCSARSLQGNGRQAQFNHPDLGGMGQWSKAE